MQNTIYTSAKPFVKWVGGKTQLLKDIKHALPANLAQMKDIIYVEPFVGGGAVLFWILQQFPNIKRAVINDINPHLITTYKIVKEQPGKLIERLKVFQNEYIPLGEEDRKAYYLAKRDIYNNSSLPEVEIAALFIFLNRTCFNGLYRVNSKVNLMCLTVNMLLPGFVMKILFWQTHISFKRSKSYVGILRKRLFMLLLMHCSILILRINL